MAASASAATVTRYQASLRSPHNALHSPSILLLLLYIIDVRRTALSLRWRRSARSHTKHKANRFGALRVVTQSIDSTKRIDSALCA